MSTIMKKYMALIDPNKKKINVALALKIILKMHR